MNKAGTKKRVKNEDKSNPKMTALPRACQSSLESVIGTIPKMVQMEVIKIASSLDFPASTTDSKNGIPNLIFRFILSIRMMAFFTTIPKRARIPISPGKLKLIPKIVIPIKVPISANGNVTKTIIAFLNELNWTIIVETIKSPATSMARKID